MRRRIKATQITHLDEPHDLLADGKPILVDLWKANCQPCRTMSGIVDELAEEFAGTAHVVKLDVGSVPGAIQTFRVQSTPTFVVLSRAAKPLSKKARKRAGDKVPSGPAPSLNPRWRISGLVKKDLLTQALVSNGAGPVGYPSSR